MCDMAIPGAFDITCFQNHCDESIRGTRQERMSKSLKASNHLAPPRCTIGKSVLNIPQSYLSRNGFRSLDALEYWVVMFCYALGKEGQTDALSL